MSHNVSEQLLRQSHLLKKISHDFNDTIDNTRPFEGLPEQEIELIEKAWATYAKSVLNCDNSEEEDVPEDTWPSHKTT